MFATAPSGYWMYWNEVGKVGLRRPSWEVHPDERLDDGRISSCKSNWVHVPAEK